MSFSPRLEDLFEHETQHARCSHLVTVGLLWIVGCLLYTLLAPVGVLAPHASDVEAAVRMGVVAPVLVAVTFAIWWGVRPVVRELLMTLASIVAPVSMIVVVTLANEGDVGASRGALTIFLLFMTVVVRLRFWYAVAACLTILAAQVGIAQMLKIAVPGDVPLVLVTITATLVANYTLEREYRLNYLHRVRSRIQSGHLAAMVNQLEELSQRDPLTGLANRRAMDAQLEELGRQNERFAVIMVDVDAFKAFNDNYGHQIGDDCLRRVAAMLRASLRRTSDRIARMGGEEFAVVLPQTSLDDARIMAERMRRAVYDLRIPHVGSPTGDVVTISAGVSASEGSASSASAMAEADKALYRAKALGRNCVQTATPTPTDARLSGPRKVVAA